MRFDPRFDAYRELGVVETAPAEVIRQAYIALARKYHPDHAPHDKRREYEERMKRINSAYEILSNPNTRAIYDRARRVMTSTITAPHVPSRHSYSRSPRDPYHTMRAGYQQRYYRVQVNTERMPPWARLVIGLFSGLGFVLGFIMGLPFGIIGCIPGALVGLIGGALLGFGAVYLSALAVPVLFLGWSGHLLMGEPGLWLGGFIGLVLGVAGVLRLWRRANSGFRN